MGDIPTPDYSILDRPEILAVLFHPRPEWGQTRPRAGMTDILIPVGEEVAVGGRFHMAEKSGPNILHFHGNGEIVADYDDIGPLYNRMGINFLGVDYRGYGRSTGRPTVAAMMKDCHTIYHFTKTWLRKNGFSGPFILMGRSLGSASALELAGGFRGEVDGLIVESGFAYAGPLLRLLGIDLEALGIEEDMGFLNIHKIGRFHQPTLIIHAEYDHIIPFSEAEALYHACSSQYKQLLKIPGANHNDIFLKGLPEYLEAIKSLIGRVGFS